MDRSRVYGHSGASLYLVDTKTLAANKVADFTGLGTQSLTDLAIDKNDRMLGITLNKLYTLNATTGEATNQVTLPTGVGNFTSLSFVPNPAPGGDDLLVTANDHGLVFQIDPTSGSATQIGAYGMAGPDEIRSSGDLIGVANFGIYATVDRGDLPGDYLAKIDPEQGWKATLAPNPTGYDDIFGLGFWGGKIYGFVNLGANTGKIIEIDPVTGVGNDLIDGSVQWYGAGVATDAPIIQ